jgi:glucose-1-phosphate cytidylyltransferase
VRLDDMVERFKQSGKLACFLAVRPPLTYHIADIGADGRVREFRPADRADMWINAGYFVLRPQIFDYMNEGEELVVEPFRRLIEADQLMAYKHDDFFRSMDTLKDRQTLEEMVEQGRTPWRIRNGATSGSRLSIAAL